MTTITKRIKRASLASYRVAASKARRRDALSMIRDELPVTEAMAAFAAHTRKYFSPVAIVTKIQDVSALEAHYSN